MSDRVRPFLFEMISSGGAISLLKTPARPQPWRSSCAQISHPTHPTQTLGGHTHHYQPTKLNRGLSYYSMLLYSKAYGQIRGVQTTVPPYFLTSLPPQLITSLRSYLFTEAPPRRAGGNCCLLASFESEQPQTIA